MCWLALLLIRIAETTAGTTWSAIADELDLVAKLKIGQPEEIIEATSASS